MLAVKKNVDFPQQRGVNSAALLKEPAVRSAYLAGMTIARLAVTFGVREAVMHDYVVARRQTWQRFDYSGIREDDRRVLVFPRHAREIGCNDIRPISVSRNSMHLQALEGR